ncbi:hypothetical protein HMPREF1624_08235 [Sporothrix schenckii ATCC 58251]|uniref:Uncharacterized protein n=1 Tax=Sporothrix schenckii (strain ATCC 58251 / de Perez 2211183) TaxID=1391915 RepID=U7PII0_SPOS1|nr:hypothetical protein HMPREF1624_08235 [Sporothrix schenckii ATCC 58251]
MASYVSDDPDAGPLLAPASTPRTRHRVRIQGRLVHVRSVSSSVSRSVSTPLAGARDTALCDRQRRGYGIGGAGNIRRPTEVVQFYALSRTGPGQDRARRRWQWMGSLFGLRGQKDVVKDGQGHHGQDRALDADADHGQRRP